MRSITTGDVDPLETARALLANEWQSCELRELVIDSDSVEEAPHSVAATIAYPDGRTFSFDGRAECFIPLSRPGPDQSRIYTALGFASFKSGEKRGAGMFEYSRRADSVLTNLDDGEDFESE